MNFEFCLKDVLYWCKKLVFLILICCKVFCIDGYVFLLILEILILVDLMRVIWRCGCFFVSNLVVSYFVVLLLMIIILLIILFICLF